jgi:7,8-dihydropterin-6-yl-methyl-4-(beta-D-ribofuranosyl)aminobenzene 5'-phosphate synthase
LPPLKHAREVFDPIPRYGVIGGFHLAGKAYEKIIPETVEDLKSFGLKVIVPGHCTGWRAVHALLDAFGEETVVPSERRGLEGLGGRNRFQLNG